MKLQPLISWWLLLPYLLAVVSAISWQILHTRRQRAGKRKQALDRSTKLRWWRRVAILLLPVAIAIGPSVQGGVSAPGIANLDVIFVVDTTPSMGALDYTGKKQRIEGVKEDLIAIGNSLQGAHMQIITFDTEANTILPLTTDATAFATAVRGMTPQIHSYSQGSTIDKPVSLVVEELKNIEATYPQHYRLLFYMGDGEQTADTPVKTFAPVANYLDGGAVLGYGTTKGAQMVRYTGLGNTSNAPSYITTIDTSTNQLTAAVSSTNPTALQTIAKQMRVTYQNRNQGGPVSELHQASQTALAIDRSQRVVHYLNLYWLAAIPFAGLLFWEWQALIVKLYQLRQRSKEEHGK